MKNLLEEFKKFINRGSVIELAVAVVVGTAFTKIVNSFVKDILMPLISIVIGDEGFENFKYVITEGDELAGIAENAIYYGRFIQNSLDFLIVAVVVFAIIKIINKLKEEFDDIVDIVDEFVDDIIDGDDEVKEKVSE